MAPRVQGVFIPCDGQRFRPTSHHSDLFNRVYLGGSIIHAIIQEDDEMDIQGSPFEIGTPM